MNEKRRCESCGMPIDAGPHRAHCVDENGRLQDFETRFARMVAWTLREHPDLNRAQAERKTLVYMASMPAWRDHPKVSGSAG
jgi:hypothetical protein